jgi:hypothetical protein
MQLKQGLHGLPQLIVVISHDLWSPGGAGDIEAEIGGDLPDDVGGNTSELPGVPTDQRVLANGVY